MLRGFSDRGVEVDAVISEVGWKFPGIFGDELLGCEEAVEAEPVDLCGSTGLLLLITELLADAGLTNGSTRTSFGGFD